MRKAFAEYRIKNGGDLLDKDEQLARFGIIENRETKELCIFISISHIEWHLK